MRPSRFDPSVIDTSSIALPRELQELVELLAENTHNVWARQRLLDGWGYGRKRDDVRKKHPCLIAYDKLPEQEKEYDRHTAIENSEGRLEARLPTGAF